MSIDPHMILFSPTDTAQESQHRIPRKIRTETMNALRKEREADKKKRQRKKLSELFSTADLMKYENC